LVRRDDLVWSAEPQYPFDAKRRIQALIGSLRTMVQHDPEQEVQGMAVPVLDATLEAVKSVLAGDPIVDAIAG
jgi:hypothetical protein